jgi:RNase P subunit RPR2
MGGHYQYPADLMGRSSGEARRLAAAVRLEKLRAKHMAESARWGRCKRCAKPLEPGESARYQDLGGRKRYCGNACKQAAHRERQARSGADRQTSIEDWLGKGE